MDRSEIHRLLEAERAHIAEVSEAFASVAGEVVSGALERAVERLAEERPDWSTELGPARKAFRGAMTSGIARSAAAVADHLRELELWLAPTVLVEDVPPDPDPRLDALGNRVWLAMSRAATPLDPLLNEFGLDPSDVPDPGGGHFGLQPRSARELDPSGRLTRIWQRYLSAWARYAGLLRLEARDGAPSGEDRDTRGAGSA